MVAAVWATARAAADREGAGRATAEAAAGKKSPGFRVNFNSFYH